MQIFCKEKFKINRQLRCTFLARKNAKLIANFSATKVTSLPSLSLCLSHRSASALPIMEPKGLVGKQKGRIMCQARNEKNASILFHTFEAIKPMELLRESRTKRAPCHQKKENVLKQCGCFRQGEHAVADKTQQPPQHGRSTPTFSSFPLFTFSF